MTLRLPPLATLTEEQRTVVRLPFDSTHLITGGPGTGKTATAIHRTAVLNAAGRATVMLMYSKVLSTYTRTAVASTGAQDVVSTYHKWLREFWLTHYRKTPPRLDQGRIDWMTCFSRISAEPPTLPTPLHIVVDEGQDMPNEFYLVMKAIAEHLTVFADDNQRINRDQSTIPEIAAVCGIRSPNSLSLNVRSTRQIAALAAAFRGGAHELDPFLPDGPRPTLIPCAHTSDVIERILRHEKEHPDETTGVLLQRTKDLYSYVRQLDGRTHNPLQGYASVARNGILADPALIGPGIKLLSWQSAKGLEFDSVFLPELQSAPGDPTSDDVRMQLFVLITRARRSLTFMYTGIGESPIVAEIKTRLE